MRILWNDSKEFSIEKMFIEEFKLIALTPAWKSGHETYTIPDDLFISANEDYIGKYILDDTNETYCEALDNWKDIIDKLSIFGYCKQSDFKNVEWF